MGTFKGIRFERQIKKELEDRGWLVTRAGASMGVFDLVAISKEQQQIRLIQCKKGWSYTETALNKLREKLKEYDGEYMVTSEVIHEE